MTDKKQNITIKEFKMWLSGVEEMQDEDWVPTPAQWAKIREKIETIDDTQPTPTLSHPTQQIRAVPDVVSFAPGGIASTVPVRPAAPSSMPAAPAPTNNPLLAGGGRIRTPDIDTSSGQYDNPFV